MLNDMILRRQR